MEARIFLKSIIFAYLIVGFTACQPEQEPTQKKTSMMYQKVSEIEVPVAKKEPKELTIHGDTRIDHYYWLNQREDEAVLNHLQAENAYREEVMSHLNKSQEDLFQELKGRIKEEDQSVPYKDNGYYYLTRFEKGKEYPIYARKKGNLDALEEILLDVNQLAEGYEFYQVGGRSVSPNNKLLVYAEDTLSRRIYTLRFKNLETGEMLSDVIEGVEGYAVWAADNETVFYVKKNPQTLRAERIFRHRLGTPVREDTEVFYEADETFSTYIGKTKSDKYLVIGSSQTVSDEYRILEADNPTGVFRVFQPRERKLEYDIAHFGNHWYIRTNLDAQNFRLMRCTESATAKENWEEVIPHRNNVLLEDLEIFQNYLVLTERKAGITQIRIRPWEGKEHYIDFPEDAYVAYTSINREFDTQLLRIGYQSMTTPNSTYDYHMEKREMTLLKQQVVLGGFDASNYTTERLMIKARDGAQVPVSVVYRKGFNKDGSQPLMLYGYGSYGASMEPYFSSARLSLLDRGFVYAIVHIRGGEEMGRQWYEDGKLLNKKNTFTDFIDCTEHLVKEGYADPENVYAMGGSAGGLLMGAVVNMRPDLYKGVIAAVPFVDVVTTMLDESIPLTTFEYDEWGNPNDPTYYQYMKSYSPYDNVGAKEYPAMLITTGLHDSQVQYWEPAKWVAKLREMKTDNNPLLLYTNMETGHGGASGRFERLREIAMEYAFVLDLAGRADTNIKG